ncbi:MAG: cobaltochelatase subunit CobN, partial [Ahrensia sp.]
MHLLLAQKGSVTDGDGEAIDLGQEPGDICFLSAADTDLAGLAHAGRPGDPALRLVNLMQLKHPMSVDTWIERTGRHAKVIVARLLGGLSYWSYAVEALRATADAHGIALAFVPGDDKPDPDCASYNTIPPADADLLWSFLREGGPDNARAFLDGCEALAEGSAVEGEANPLLKAGAFYTTLEPVADAPHAAIICYRALVQSGQTAPVHSLALALETQGMAVTAIFVSS